MCGRVNAACGRVAAVSGGCPWVAAPTGGRRLPCGTHASGCVVGIGAPIVSAAATAGRAAVLVRDTGAVSTVAAREIVPVIGRTGCVPAAPGARRPVAVAAVVVAVVTARAGSAVTRRRMRRLWRVHRVRGVRRLWRVRRVRRVRRLWGVRRVRGVRRLVAPDVPVVRTCGMCARVVPAAVGRVAPGMRGRRRTARFVRPPPRAALRSGRPSFRGVRRRSRPPVRAALRVRRPSRPAIVAVGRWRPEGRVLAVSVRTRCATVVPTRPCIVLPPVGARALCRRRRGPQPSQRRRPGPPGWRGRRPRPCRSHGRSRRRRRGRYRGGRQPRGRRRVTEQLCRARADRRCGRRRGRGRGRLWRRRQADLLWVHQQEEQRVAVPRSASRRHVARVHRRTLLPGGPIFRVRRCPLRAWGTRPGRRRPGVARDSLRRSAGDRPGRRGRDGRLVCQRRVRWRRVRRHRVRRRRVRWRPACDVGRVRPRARGRSEGYGHRATRRCGARHGPRDHGGRLPDRGCGRLPDRGESLSYHGGSLPDRGCGRLSDRGGCLPACEVRTHSGGRGRGHGHGGWWRGPGHRRRVDGSDDQGLCVRRAAARGPVCRNAHRRLYAVGDRAVRARVPNRIVKARPPARVSGVSADASADASAAASVGVAAGLCVVVRAAVYAFVAAAAAAEATVRRAAARRPRRGGPAVCIAACRRPDPSRCARSRPRARPGSRRRTRPGPGPGPRTRTGRRARTRLRRCAAARGASRPGTGRRAWAARRPARRGARGRASAATCRVRRRRAARPAATRRDALCRSACTAYHTCRRRRRRCPAAIHLVGRVVWIRVHAVCLGVAVDVGVRVGTIAGRLVQAVAVAPAPVGVAWCSAMHDAGACIVVACVERGVLPGEPAVRLARRPAEPTTCRPRDAVLLASRVLPMTIIATVAGTVAVVVAAASAVVSVVRAAAVSVSVNVVVAAVADAIIIVGAVPASADVARVRRCVVSLARQVYAVVRRRSRHADVRAFPPGRVPLLPCARSGCPRGRRGRCAVRRWHDVVIHRRGAVAQRVPRVVGAVFARQAVIVVVVVVVSSVPVAVVVIVGVVAVLAEGRPVRRRTMRRASICLCLCIGLCLCRRRLRRRGYVSAGAHARRRVPDGRGVVRTDGGIGVRVRVGGHVDVCARVGVRVRIRVGGRVCACGGVLASRRARLRRCRVV